MVNSGHGPGDADSQEDVDSITAGDVADGCIGVLILNGSHFTGERIYGQQESLRARIAMG